MSFDLTRHERLIILFLISFLVIGAVIKLYKNYHGYSNEIRAHAIRMDSLRNEFERKSLEIKRESQKSTLLNTKIHIGTLKKVNINTATLEELIQLPKIGPELAKRIIQYRDEKGKFKTIKDIVNVRGIGLKTYKKIESSITVN